MPLDVVPDFPSLVEASIPISSSFKYLGIQVTPNPYISLNLTPLLAKFQDTVKVWSKLKMSLVGQTNLIKMILMPHLLHVLQNSLVVIP